MRRGPKPTPARLLKLKGTYRKDRHGNGEDPVPPLPRVPRPPATLGETARREWRRMAKQLHAVGLLTVADLPAFEAYCIVRARAVDAEAVVAKDGRTITTPQGLKRHPELITAEKAWADARRYEQVFGMSPSARRGIGIPVRDEDNRGENNPFGRLDPAERYFEKVGRRR